MDVHNVCIAIHGEEEEEEEEEEKKKKGREKIEKKNDRGRGARALIARKMIAAVREDQAQSFTMSEPLKKAAGLVVVKGTTLALCT